jgi:hypothetical protein
MGKWIWNILVSLDQTCGVILSPLIFYKIQSPDETISSRCGKIMEANGGVMPWRYPLAKFIVWVVDCIDPGHFPRSIERDEN